VAEPLPQGKHAPALALARPGEQGVARRAQGLAPRRRARHKVRGQLIERVAETVAEACPREQRSHTASRAVKASSQDASDPLCGLVLGRRTWKLLIRLDKSRRTGGRGVAQVPEDPATDHGGEIDLVGETATGLFIGPNIGGEWQPTPGEHRDQTLAIKRTDEAIERHGRDMVADGAPCPTEPAMRRSQGLAGHRGSHLTIAEDAVGEDRAYRFARRTL
jgi:hypothetical protein